MFDEERFDALLEEAFEAGYNSALEEVYNESAFNLDAEMDAFDEAQKAEGKGVANDYLGKLPNSAYKRSMTRVAALTNSNKDYPGAAAKIAKKISNDYKGNVPKHLYPKAAQLAERIRKANSRGKINDHSAMLKY